MTRDEKIIQELLDEAVEDAQIDHDPDSVHPEKLMSDEIIRLRLLLTEGRDAHEDE